MQVVELGGQDLAQVAGSVPFVRWGLGLEGVARAWRGPGSVAFERYRRAYGTSLTVIGDPEAAADVAARLAPRLDVGSVTLPRAAVVPPHVPFGPPDAGTGWEWMWTDTEPDPSPGEDRVVELDADSAAVRAELGAFLAEHSPRHSAEPDDELARAWLGVRTPDGDLVACLALYEAVPGVDLMASVAVAAQARGQGLGLAITAAATRRMLREHPPVATVDLYSDNDAARALYRRLGYRLDQEFTSYPLRRAA
ncbi:MAG TPA: GNAT family N-acetyltransferase [Kineosporiaceae bacterium]|nr:GNAT family N-acetyltransferase [Kineosporiaceae bacterium]